MALNPVAFSQPHSSRCHSPWRLSAGHPRKVMSTSPGLAPGSQPLPRITHPCIHECEPLTQLSMALPWWLARPQPSGVHQSHLPTVAREVFKQVPGLCPWLMSFSLTGQGQRPGHPETINERHLLPSSSAPSGQRCHGEPDRQRRHGGPAAAQPGDRARYGEQPGPTATRAPARSPTSASSRSMHRIISTNSANIGMHHPATTWA